MSLKFGNYFRGHPDFQFQDGLFHQTGFEGNPDFVTTYLNLRQSEGRLYDDHVVLDLPEIPFSHPLSKEWVIRKRSADRLLNYLQKKSIEKVVDVGCGNGWLIHYLSKSLQAELCGVDINESELKQAARLFGDHERITFAFADIHSQLFKNSDIDIFVFAGAIQYFPDIGTSINRLFSSLKPGGEIHILDSPIYTEGDLEAAKIRSEKHFEQASQASIKKHYYHHDWESFRSLKYDLLYDPSLVYRRLRRYVLTDSPFPWLKISKPLH